MHRADFRRMAGVRHADPRRDAAACAAIYAPHVDPGFASFEAVPPDAAEMGRRIAAAARTHAWLVLEREDGEIAGFAYAGPHRTRGAYRWSAEVAVYVNGAHVAQGVGRALYGALLALLAGQNLRWALAGIALPNASSIGLHEALGFERVGVYRSIGYKAGAWRDVGWWQCDLARGDEGPPPDPLGPRRL